MLILKQTVFAFAFLCIVAAGSPNALAQDEAGAELQKAIGELQGNPLHLTANIEVEKPGGDKTNGVMSMVLGMTTGGGKDSYTGKMDVYVAGDGALAAASPEGLPQVKVMSNGERNVYSQTYASKSYDLEKLLALVRGTLDLEGLGKEVSRAKRVRVSEEDGKKTYRVTLNGDFFEVVDASDGQSQQERMMKQAMKRMKPQVMEGVLTMSVNESGKPASIKYSLQYSDPMKGMVGQAMAGGGGAMRIGGGGKDMQNVLGDKVIVSYEVQTDSAGLAKDFADQAAEMLGASAK